MSLFKMESCRGLYHMGETIDSSRNINVLTVTGATVITGKLGNAYSFDGIDDRLNANGLIASSANDTTGTIPFTVNLDSDTAAFGYIFSVSNGSGATRSEIGVRANWGVGNNNLDIYAIVDGTLVFQVNTPLDSLTPFIGSWLTGIVKHNGTQISEIKLNNVSQTITRGTTTDETVWMKAVITDATNKADTATFGDLNIDGVYGTPLEGDLDETGIFSGVWTDADDTAFWNGGLGREMFFTMNTNETSNMGRMVNGMEFTQAKNLVI